MKILIIPEDFRNDQYLLAPLFRRLFAQLGLRKARVEVLKDPLLGGVREALNLKTLREIIDQYQAMTDIFVLCVDRDKEIGRRRQLDTIEAEFGPSCIFLAENAWEELETWTLAGLKLPAEWHWDEVRREVSVKERYFRVLAESRGVADGPGGGRKALGDEAARRVDVIRRKCPEDFDALARRLDSLVRGIP